MTLTTYKKILKPKTLHESKKMYLKFRYKGIALMLFDLKMGLVKVILGSSFFMSHMVIHFHAQITEVFSLSFSIFGPHFKLNQIILLHFELKLRTLYANWPTYLQKRLKL